MHHTTFHRTIFPALALALSVAAMPARGADDTPPEAVNAHFQGTYIWQTKPAFDAPYSGASSLRPEREKGYSFSATAALGARPWAGAEAYLDAELVQGVPMSGLTGLGGMSNGEQQKSSGANPTLYRARAFVRQTWDMGGEHFAVESDSNQLAGMVDRRRVVLTVGNLALSDMFDNNAYAHDARGQFMNWALLTHGAFDFASDARGYSWGAVLEWYRDDWALRAGRFLQPAQSNGLPLDTRILKHHGDQVELEHGHAIGELEGKLRLLVFRNKVVMGGFRDALALAALQGGAPDVSLVRKERVKYGFGVNAEQSVTGDLGVFGRASWNDGASETYAFTEIERSLSAGAALKGTQWNRGADTLGLALVRNGLSAAHRDYLAAGGHGAFIGDGKLNYRNENIVEAYYSAAVVNGAWLTLDLQHIANPAYNADRGPVRIASLRLHAQF